MGDKTTCVEDLTLGQLSDLLVSAKIDVNSCILIHPIEETVLSFDMLNGNKQFMFSEGRSYFTDVLKCLSLRRVIENTIVRSFFDSYTGKEALSDWNKMDKDTRSLFRKNSSPTNFYQLFIRDIKRIMKGAVEQTMYSIDTICNTAQQTLTQALHFHAVLNMVPCMPVTEQREGKREQSRPVSTKSSTAYFYERHISQACAETESAVHMTHLVPPHEDTVIVFDRVTKKVLAFLCEGRKLSPLDVVFFGGVSHETFTRGRHTLQTHSLCETIIPLEKYLHEMESTRMKVLKEVGFRTTVIIQNADDYEGPIAKKKKVDQTERTGYESIDPHVAQSIKEYKKEIRDHWGAVSKCIEEIADGSVLAAPLPLNGRDVTEGEEGPNINVPAFGNAIAEDSTNVLKRVQDLQRRQGPLGGPSVDVSLAYIENGTARLQKAALKQQHNNFALRRAMTAWQKSYSNVCEKNQELAAKLASTQHAYTMQTRTMSTVLTELDATKAGLRHLKNMVVIPEDRPDLDGNYKLNTGLRVNAVGVNGGGHGDYNVEISEQNNINSVRYVNVSDFGEKSSRYLNANFAIPPVDESIKGAARNAWENEVKSRFFLRDHLYSVTGNHIERQPSFDTTSVYLGGFCKQFMNFRIMGRVVFDSDFISKTDALDYMFTRESEGSAIDLVNGMQG
jgi:hypothetical protein